MSKQTLAERVRSLMNEQGFNQSTLAQRSGVDRTVINRLLNRGHIPKAFQLALLAQTFKIEIEALIEGIELPQHVTETVDQMRGLAERTLRAEAERDAVRADNRVLTDQLEQERREHEHLAETEREAREANERDLRQRIAQTEAAHAAALQEKDREIAKLREVLRRGATDMQRVAASHESLRVDRDRLQQQLAQERANRVGGQVFAGFAGLLVGRALE